MARELFVDKEECTSCAQCVDNLPEVFGIDDEDDTAEIINANGASEDEIQEEIDACQGECLHWKE